MRGVEAGRGIGTNDRAWVRIKRRRRTMRRDDLAMFRGRMRITLNVCELTFTCDRLLLYPPYRALLHYHNLLDIEHGGAALLCFFSTYTVFRYQLS